MGSFIEYMNEEKNLNRWAVFKIAIVGSFCGALLTVSFMFLGFA